MLSLNDFLFHSVHLLRMQRPIWSLMSFHLLPCRSILSTRQHSVHAADDVDMDVTARTSKLSCGDETYGDEL